jgi:AraC-like DNA-binding protein
MFGGTVVGIVDNNSRFLSIFVLIVSHLSAPPSYSSSTRKAAGVRRKGVPLGSAWVARVAGVSIRQLERLFAAELGSTIAIHYRAIPLQKAAQLLRMTAHTFTRHFQATPRQYRMDGVRRARD